MRMEQFRNEDHAADAYARLSDEDIDLSGMGSEESCRGY